MANIIIHNISDREDVSAPKSCITIGHIKIRPGKHAFIPEESVNSKVYDLHGNFVWIGDLPSHLTSTSSKVSTPSTSLTRDEVLTKLQSMSKEELIALNSGITPSYPKLEDNSKRYVLYKILALCFSSDVDLNPETFFWLGRWTKLPNGDYVEI